MPAFCISTLIAFLIALVSVSHGLSTFPPELQRDFEGSCSIRLPNGIVVDKYISKRTGLQVVVAKVEGPMVAGYFTFATEAQDDDGLPHTLEHLVFLGSEEYPYKGILDLLANKCLASGTNAWTATDSTTYTMETAGSDGFLNLLPVYLDHMLYPTLTDTAFTTEVYHVTGAGKDAGVVYSEMQSHSSSSRDRMYNPMIRELYPKPSGYRYETGGLVENLRNSTNNEKVRAYHKKFYRPENLQILVIGQIDTQELFTAIHKYEDKIVQKGPLPPYTRPWLSEVPPLSASIHKDVVYPSSSLDDGIVFIAFRGPLNSEYRRFVTLNLLLEYLDFTSVSPLNSAFIEIEEPMASSISHRCMDYSQTSCYLSFNGVPLKFINQIEDKFRATVEKLYSDPELFKVTDIREVIAKQILRIENRLEASPQSLVAYPTIDYGIYGNSCTDLEHRLDKITLYKELAQKPAQFWKDLLQKYILSSYWVVVRGRPSQEEAERVEKYNKERVEKRIAKLGKEGLEKKAQELAQAKKINEIPPPSSILDSVPIPSTDNVNYHPLKAYSNHESLVPADHPSFPLSKLPIRFQLDDVHSNFVLFSAIMDTSSLTASQRLYLPLLLQLVFESDVLRNGTELMSHDEVIKGLSRDLLVTNAEISLSLRGVSTFSCSIFCNYAMLIMKMEASKYATGISWLHDIMFNLKLSVPRVKVKTNKLLNSISTNRRGSKVISLINEGNIFRNESNQNQVNYLRQQTFLKKVSSKLDDENLAQSVVDDLNAIFKSLTNLSRTTFHMATDVTKLAESTDIMAPWQKLVGGQATLPTTTKSWKVISDVSLKRPTMARCKTSLRSGHETTVEQPLKNCTPTSAYIAGMPSLESSFLQQTTSSIANYSHHDVPALMTAIQFFTQLEGPMWKEIRGRGLAYTYSINLLLSEGTLTLKLVKAAQLVNAYKETLSLLNGYINGDRTWDPSLLDTAKSSLMYEVIDRESSITSAIQESLYSYFRNVTGTYNRDLLPIISKLSLEEVQRVTRQYFSPLLSPDTSKCVVVCPPADVTNITLALESLGHTVEDVTVLEDSRFA